MAAPTFTDFWNELKGEIPQLSPFLAQKFVQRSWDDILHARKWSFLLTEGYLYAPALITTGTVTVTQFSTQVQADADAKVALDAVAANVGAPLTSRQFRLPTKPIYQIAAYDDVTGIITLDRNFMESSAAGAAYEVYRCWYTPPLYNGQVDFLRWVSICDPVIGYKIRGKNLAFPRTELDRQDPLRVSYDNPIKVCPHHTDANGVPWFELWPHPRIERTYTAPFERRGQDMGASDTLPTAIHSSLLMNGARMHAYVWASANAGRFPDLQGTNWLQLKIAVQKDWDRELQFLKVQDEESFLQTWAVFDGEGGWPYPIDSAWLQQHDPGPYS